MIICAKCKIKKEDCEFSKHEIEYKWSRCKLCRRQEYLDNQDEKKEQVKQYNLTHRQEINKRQRERKKSDPSYRLRNLISMSINRFLKKFNLSKNGKSSSKYLQYTVEQYKQHLESLFEPWMNWDNQGRYNSDTWDDNDPSTWTWNLDHIIPHSDFHYTNMEDDDFKKCWDLSNLRPYSAKQNNYDGTNRIRHKKK